MLTSEIPLTLVRGDTFSHLISLNALTAAGLPRPMSAQEWETLARDYVGSLSIGTGAEPLVLSGVEVQIRTDLAGVLITAPPARMAGCSGGPYRLRLSARDGSFTWTVCRGRVTVES